MIRTATQLSRDAGEHRVDSRRTCASHRSSLLDRRLTLTAAWRPGADAPGQVRPGHSRMTIMTTLYVREGTEFREAEPADILTRAHALISQRYRTGSPGLSEPRRTEEFLRLHLGGSDYCALLPSYTIN